MLAKNKTSAFLLSVITLLFGLLGYRLIPDPRYQVDNFFSPWQAGLVLAALFLGMAFAFARWVIADMDQDAYGWGGLVRWSTGGLLIGLLLHLVEIYRPAQADGSFLLELLFDTVLPLLVCFLIFWLIFRRSLLARASSSSTSGSSLVVGRWFLIIGGVLVTGLGLFLLYRFSAGQVKNVLLAVGTVMMGWSSILFGAIMHAGRRDRFESRLAIFSLFLVLVAFIVLVTGVLWR